MNKCEHINTEYEPFDTGITITFDPQERLELVCQDCNEIMESDYDY